MNSHITILEVNVLLEWGGVRMGWEMGCENDRCCARADDVYHGKIIARQLAITAILGVKS